MRARGFEASTLRGRASGAKQAASYKAAEDGTTRSARCESKDNNTSHSLNNATRDVDILPQQSV